jgi:serine/threonine-protein phosphatase 2B regulatory subunit
MGCVASKSSSGEANDNVWSATTTTSSSSSRSGVNSGRDESIDTKNDKTPRTKSYHETVHSKLRKNTFFSENDVEVLKTLFDSVAHDDNVIDEGEFIEALFGKKKREELLRKKNKNDEGGKGGKFFTFERRLFEKFDTNDEGYIFFDEFVKTLNVFHPRASTNDKAKFAFDLYDVNGNGEITREELKQLVSAVMKRSIFLNLDEEAIERVLDNTFEQVDIEKDGSISYEEFYRMVKENRKCIANMTLPTLTTLSTEYPEFIFAGSPRAGGEK